MPTEAKDTFETGLEDLDDPSLAEDLKMSGLEGVLNNLRPMARALGIGEPALAKLEQTNPLIGLIEALPPGTKITIEIGGQPK